MQINKSKLTAAHLKILRFFHENPSCIDTPVGIALWTNENVKIAKKVLEDLASFKILVVHKVPSTTSYSYTQDPSISKKVEAILKSLKKQ